MLNPVFSAAHMREMGMLDFFLHPSHQLKIVYHSAYILQCVP